VGVTNLGKSMNYKGVEEIFIEPEDLKEGW